MNYAYKNSTKKFSDEIVLHNAKKAATLSIPQPTNIHTNTPIVTTNMTLPNTYSSTSPLFTPPTVTYNKKSYDSSLHFFRRKKFHRQFQVLS